MSTKKEILVYAHWEKLKNPQLMGILTAIHTRGKELFSFEYTHEWLRSTYTPVLDPELQLYSGRYFPRDNKINFGAFLDSCPDRWGRVLMSRRESALARQEKRAPKNLLESDYLLGVFDLHRMGALRFKLNDDGNFLNDNPNMTVPPWTSLRQLEHASTQFEQDKSDDREYLKWINLLIAPGSSLGGARPKASVIDPKGHLWIAKFPSINDEKDVGAWEMVVNILAKNAGIRTAISEAQKFNSNHHTYLTKRFDRNKKNERIHFASAMTLLGHSDGAGSETGVSYLELAEFIIKHGADVNSDLEELWRRIVFHICVKNTDDHLRNHGFLLANSGWRLAPAFDINPNEFGTGLALNISENDNALSIDLALEVAAYFRVPPRKANQIIKRIHISVNTWKDVAKKIGITRAAQDRMKSAFEPKGN